MRPKAASAPAFNTMIIFEYVFCLSSSRTIQLIYIVDPLYRINGGVA